MASLCKAVLGLLLVFFGATTPVESAPAPIPTGVTPDLGCYGCVVVGKL